VNSHYREREEKFFFEISDRLPHANKNKNKNKKQKHFRKGMFQKVLSFAAEALTKSFPVNVFLSLLGIRATRLGEFSPNGRLFTLGGYLKMTKVARILGYFIPR
jgi:hypothetical protein